VCCADEARTWWRCHALEARGANYIHVQKKADLVSPSRDAAARLALEPSIANISTHC
jgi:hypothetical protein